MLRTAVVVGTLFLGIGVLAAQQDAFKSAQTIMKANGKSLGGVLSPMNKGDKPYDQAAVNEALNVLVDTGKKLPTMFPEGMIGMKWDGDYSASPRIWQDKAGFDVSIATFVKAVTDAKASVKDLDTLKAAFPAIGKSCGGCHETFRVKNL